MDPDQMEGAALDSWEEQADPGPGNCGDTVDIGEQFSALNVNAKPFVPNVNAREFVPNFGNFSPKTEQCNNKDVGELWFVDGLRFPSSGSADGPLLSGRIPSILSNMCAFM